MADISSGEGVNGNIQQNPVSAFSGDSRPGEAGHTIHMLWEQEMPDSIKEERKTHSPSTEDAVRQFVKIAGTGFGLLVLALILCIQLQDNDYGNLIAAGITTAVAAIVILIWRYPRKEIHWFALTNRYILLYNTSIERDDVQGWLDGTSTALATAQDIADDVRFIASFVTDLPDNSPAPGIQGTGHTQPAGIIGLTNVNRIELRLKDHVLVVKNQRPEPPLIYLLCQSADHMEQVLDFLKQRCPNAAVS